MIKNQIKEGEKDFHEIFKRLKNQDFSGNTGLAIKNSIFQFSTGLAAKIGSLIFTIIIARLLMPELFGLYNLALSTILIFVTFSELGFGPTLVRYVSKYLGKRKNKIAKSYLVYIAKVRFVFVALSLLLLLLFSWYISNVFYQKPIFLAMIAGLLYIIALHFVGFLESVLQASNYFRGILYKEIVFQVSRIILVPMAILFSLKYLLSPEKILFFSVLFLSLTYILGGLFIFFGPLKKLTFIKEEGLSLTKNQKTGINKFLISTGIFVFSGLFFSYIDKVMLGRFVAAEFIGYYSAAFGLVGALTSVIGFGIVLLPIFSRIKGIRLDKSMNKAILIVAVAGILLAVVTFFLSDIATLIIYGKEYGPASGILKVLSLIVILLPLIGVYTAYFVSTGQPQKITKILIFSTLLNIFLNYILITALLPYGDLLAVYGATIATIVSQVFYLGGLILVRR